MKFGKSLSTQIEKTLPEWGDKFLSYKGLKKRLKFISPARATKRARTGCVDGGDVGLSPDEADFVGLLEAELEKFNDFFIEKEEDYVIRQKELQDRAAVALQTGSKEELTRVKKEIVDFHGEMVLLENYSALNYTGIVKILKKYDKRTGALIRLPFTQKVLEQPFFTTDVLLKLVNECEGMLDHLFPKTDLSISAAAGEKKPAHLPVKTGMPNLPEVDNMESKYLQSTIAALRALKEIRSGSSTVSEFSLPPLTGSEAEEQWHKMLLLKPSNKDRQC